VCRVAAVHGMIDLWGHAAARIPQSDLVLVTPRFSQRCLPRSVAASDILLCDSAGKIVHGHGELPRCFRGGTELFGFPRFAMAAAIAGHALKPLTHMESRTVFGNEVTYEPGIGMRAAGADPLACLAALYHCEYLAQANSVVAAEADVRGIAREDSDRIWRQFSGQHHYREFFESLDPGPREHPFLSFAKAKEDLKRRLAFSCRALWERGTLVAFLEHISHRAADGKHFYMSASKTFRDIGPDDICVLDDEANSVSGPKPPGFKWFHAQLLRERKDAVAVVHTHDVHGRAYALSPRKLVPSQRVGLAIGTAPLPTYGRCDLIVDAAVRRATLDALAHGPIVHEIGHGTDFVAATLEQATVDAIQREAYLEMDALVRRFGAPKALDRATIDAIRKNEAPAEDWWWFYAAEVGAPRRSAAGL